MNKELFVTDLFKMYCEDRHAEDSITTNGKNYNEMQDVFANTELFDTSMLANKNMGINTDTIKEISTKTANENKAVVLENDFLKEISLPFLNNFVKRAVIQGYNIYECVFIREFSPTLITGALWVPNKEVNLNLPFCIDTESGTFKMEGELINRLYEKENQMSTSEKQELMDSWIKDILFTIDTICNLPKHTVISDTPKSSVYYPKKKATGIRVTNRPIYYVFSKDEEVKKEGIKRIKPMGHLEYTHSFKVRGHWRRLKQNSIGKNRNGEYKVYGFTWVTEFCKGKGELVKRVRVLKS